MPCVIESPYAGDVAENIAYAEAMTIVLAGRGVGAYASHIHLARMLDDSIPAHRELGIAVGLDIASAMDFAVFATDLGAKSTGMQAAYDKHIADEMPIVCASIAKLYDGESWQTTVSALKSVLAHHPDRCYLLQQCGLVFEVVSCLDWIEGEPRYLEGNLAIAASEEIMITTG